MQPSTEEKAFLEMLASTYGTGPYGPGPLKNPKKKKKSKSNMLQAKSPPPKKKERGEESTCH